MCRYPERSKPFGARGVYGTLVQYVVTLHSTMPHVCSNLYKVPAALTSIEQDESTKHYVTNRALEGGVPC